jgi:hypothetical protein
MTPGYAYQPYGSWLCYTLKTIRSPTDWFVGKRVAIALEIEGLTTFFDSVSIGFIVVMENFQ